MRMEIQPDPQSTVVVVNADGVIQVGDQGPPGAPGPVGPQGPPGVAGPQGQEGPQGDKGDKGDQGIQGIQGAPGAVPEAPQDSKQYARENAAWSPIRAGSSVYVGDVAPTGVPDNSLWWESDTGTLYVLFNDGDSSQWVQAAPGAVGAQGLPGPAGPAGPAGPPGTPANTAQFVQKAGDAMTGGLATAPSVGLIQGAGGSPAFTVEGDAAGNRHAFMTFLTNGVFGGNFGMAPDGTFYHGGFSYGVNNLWQFWTARNLNPSAYVSNARLALVGDYLYNADTGLVEPYAGSAVSGATGCSSQNLGFNLRHRYLQVYTSSWWTVGYA